MWSSPALKALSIPMGADKKWVDILIRRDHFSRIWFYSSSLPTISSCPQCTGLFIQLCNGGRHTTAAEKWWLLGRLFEHTLLVYRHATRQRWGEQEYFLLHRLLLLSRSMCLLTLSHKPEEKLRQTAQGEEKDLKIILGFELSAWKVNGHSCQNTK